MMLGHNLLSSSTSGNYIAEWSSGRVALNTDHLAIPKVVRA